ncbi:unnamed protein product [Zymoseptoria tritici ST99CH_1E4]|uniref:Uncharacterized protein n=1 Tax=Zymoseptoria tritici ST99CH_1E4 TaxID=1276532 RepID=A0A2H1H9I2_ZYMTR|nr:unnamed protein product [Zymoseptoria tritici ST99CH_1E4]
MPEKSPSGQHPHPAINRPKDTGADSTARLSRKNRKSPNKDGILFRGYGAVPPARHSQDNRESQGKADHSTRPAHAPPDGSKLRRECDHTPVQQSADLPTRPAPNRSKPERKSEASLKGQRAAQPGHLSWDDRYSWRHLGKPTRPVQTQNEIRGLERQLDAMKLQFIYLANLVHDKDSSILTSFFSDHHGIGMSRQEYLETDIELLELSALVENKSPMNNASWIVSPNLPDNNIAQHLAALDLNILRRAERTGGPADFQRVAQAINNRLAPDKRTLHKRALRDNLGYVAMESRAVLPNVDSVLPQEPERAEKSSPTSKASRKDTTRSLETDTVQPGPAELSPVNDDSPPIPMDRTIAKQKPAVDLSIASPGEFGTPFQKLAHAISRKLAFDKGQQQGGRIERSESEGEDSAVRISLRSKEDVENE